MVFFLPTWLDGSRGSLCQVSTDIHHFHQATVNIIRVGRITMDLHLLKMAMVMAITAVMGTEAVMADIRVAMGEGSDSVHYMTIDEQRYVIKHRVLYNICIKHTVQSMLPLRGQYTAMHYQIPPIASAPKIQTCGRSFITLPRSQDTATSECDAARRPTTPLCSPRLCRVTDRSRSDACIVCAQRTNAYEALGTYSRYLSPINSSSGRGDVSDDGQTELERTNRQIYWSNKCSVYLSLCPIVLCLTGVAPDPAKR